MNKIEKNSLAVISLIICALIINTIQLIFDPSTKKLMHEFILGFIAWLGYNLSESREKDKEEYTLQWIFYWIVGGVYIYNIW